MPSGARWSWVGTEPLRLAKGIEITEDIGDIISLFVGEERVATH
jgi:hypothetical protein